MATGDSGWQVWSWVWENWDKIKQRLGEIRDWWQGRAANIPEPERSILMIGPGGVGKTSLAKLLSDQFNWLFDAPRDYVESPAVERYTIGGEPEIEVVVPPGQEHRREGTWPELLSHIAAGKYRGVILLAAYGYHSIGISYKMHRLYKNDKDAFLRDYLEDRRSEELKVLRQLAPCLKLSPKRLWLLTVVTKQDLWWPKRADVEQHYRDGEYGAEIQRLLGEADTRRFRHETLLASLVISNFMTGENEKLCSNAEGYDYAIQVASVRRLFEMAFALKEWEVSNESG